MQEGTSNIGTPAGADEPRRAVNADSFRRLTALLKKPVAAELAPAAVVIPDLVPAEPAPDRQQIAQVALPAPFVPEEPAKAEAIENVAVPEAEPPAPETVAFASPMAEAPVEEQALALAPELAPEVELEAAPATPETEPQVEVEAEPVAAEPIAEPALPEAEPEVELEAEPAPAEPVAEPAPPEAAPEPELHLAEVEVAPAEAQAPVGEVAPPEVLAAVEPEPVADLPQPPPEIEIAAAAAETASRTVAARLAPARSRAPDAFSIIPDAPAPARAELEIRQTPEQEAESAELAQSLMDMMAASAGGGQPQERALASDTLLRLLPRLPARTRTTLAQRLTMMESPPPFLVAKLIADRDLAVSGPMLEDCMHISDEDLLQVVASGHPDKRRLIARRRRISRPVSEALAATGDGSVLLTLVRNQGAEIAAEGFALLAQAAAQNGELLAPLCTRQDLPVHFAFELFWLAPAQLRRYLLSRFLTDSENLTRILRITMDSVGEAAPADAGIDLAAIGQALLRFMASDTSVAGRDEQINLLAAAAKVKPATVERILQDDQGEPLMALLKVLGVPRSMLEAEMHQFASGSLHLIDPSRNLAEVQAVFDQLSFTKARILLTYWDWATTNSGPYAPIN